MSVKAELNIRLAATETLAAVAGDQPKWQGALQKLESLLDGTAAGEADLLFMEARSLGDGASEVLDLTGGGLETPLNEAFDAAEMVALMVINAPLSSGAANTTNLTLGNATNAFEGFLSAGATVGPIPPGGVFFIAASDAAGLGAVSAGSTDGVQVANSAGAAATYQIAMLARSATS